MRKILIVAPALALILGGCAIPGAAPQTTVTVTEEAPREIPERATDPDDLYMDLLASEGIRASRDTSIDTARLICEALDAGYEKDFLAEMAMDSGFSLREAAAIVAASIVVYCPRHES
jgi:hypothetical protein